MFSMRLSATSVPSSPIAVRRISMPLSLVPEKVWGMKRDIAAARTERYPLLRNAL